MCPSYINLKKDKVRPKVAIQTLLRISGPRSCEISKGLQIRPHHWRKESHGDAPGILMMPIPG